MLVEGNSMRATSRMADVSINTVTKLLVDLGTAFAAYQDRELSNLPCKRIQVDEIWAFTETCTTIATIAKTESKLSWNIA
jgi:hypothetical protein